jgi:MoCo/4Fe-4S cofactor protein with predicted Tat translocation signal
MSPIATRSTSAASSGAAGNEPVSDGPQYWRSIEQLAQSPELEQYIENEFPSLAVAIEETDRRQFLRLLGATLALAGVTSSGCRRWPVEEVLPHTSRPSGTSPGVAQHYATAIEWNGVATGVLAKSYDGRPIKIEGNPDHPLSGGAASPHAQASILELYDPDRSRHPIQRDQGGPHGDGEPQQWDRRWAEFQAFADPHFQSLRQRDGEGLAMLIQPTSSPSWQRLHTELEQSMPKARWFEYQPLHRDNEYAGSRAAFGRALRSQYQLQNAQTIVLFDADLFGAHPAHLKLARDWAAGRKSVDHGTMNRLYVVEPGLSITGSVADVRLPAKPSLVRQCVAHLAYRLGIIANQPSGLSQREAAVVDAAAGDLVSAGANGVVAAGPAQDAATIQLVHAINQRLGSVGHTLSYTDEPLAGTSGCLEQIGQLSELLHGNVINTLVIVGGNPVYDAPADAPLDLTSGDSRALTSIHLSLYDNETSRDCTWHLPAAHFLECWGDGRGWDGTYTLQQPLIRPMFDGKSPIELLTMLQGQASESGLPMVRSTFEKQFSGAKQRDWDQALHDGLQADSQYEAVAATAVQIDEREFAGPSNAEWEVRFVADFKTQDGRFANSAWLQELPDPLTKLTWDNAALISTADAEQLRLTTGDVVRLSVDDPETSIEIPVYVMPGQARGCITLPLGYGRTSAGHIGNNIGSNVYPLRRSTASYQADGCRVTKTGRRHELVTTQEHDVPDAVAQRALTKRLGSRGEPGMIIHEALLADYQHDHHAVHEGSHAVHAAPLFDLPIAFDSPHKWGMSIDLNACIGCGGCVLACQAENNIPVVGKANVAVNREMHWIRIDRYFKGEVEEPDVVHLPMACAHCENAPCEQVCPVAATVHDSEGLNSMVYNRCVGTRYCANNCPYKVRRFNYFDFHATDPRSPAQPWVGLPDEQQSSEVSPLKKMAHNPEVTVRMRGVMEKCTYCVQRIVEARIEAKNEHAQGRRDSQLVSDGEVQTACQATCPTRAIVFGDLNDPESGVSQARGNARSYEILEELNLGARTTYLAKIRNRERA